MNSKPIFITFTSPTCAGKSYLLNFARKSGENCLVSTTTRKQRANEVEGVDYYFISNEESLNLEKNGRYIELVNHSHARYGVTLDEWELKMKPGELTFLIVEPTGLLQYVKPVEDIGAIWLKYYIETDITERLNRFKKRLCSNIDNTPVSNLKNVVSSFFDRHTEMLTTELMWKYKAKWTRILDGTVSDEDNFQLICEDIKNITRDNNG